MTTLEAPAFAAQNTTRDAKANQSHGAAEETQKHSHQPAASSEHKHLQNVSVSISYSSPDDFRVTNEEIEQYIARGRELEPSKDLAWIDLAVEAEDVAIHYGYHAQPFERIRRITG
ncbi:MAG: hypothetical protein HFK11_00230, partial [Eggerthellaceae bacterium]|nr:hypothetical protein [Eggerthellaceae bacterium]